MRRVSVSIHGKDNETHVVEVYAASLFDAAHRAMQQQCIYWWFDPSALLEVRAGAEHWQVSQSKVREARKTKRV
jgi:hypothetical protein